MQIADGVDPEELALAPGPSGRLAWGPPGPRTGLGEEPMPQRSLVLLAGAALLLSASSARAQCGGICLYEIGTPDSARSAAGAGARAEDAATTSWNPAASISSRTIRSTLRYTIQPSGSHENPPGAARRM